MSTTTYEMNQNEITKLDQQYNRIVYNINNTGKEKDIIISQLKAKIFELELHEKNIDLLNERYKQLECEFCSLNDYVHHLECEKKIRDEEINNHIIDLQNEKENLQIDFNQKISNNTNLFSENNILANNLELKDTEIFNLQNKLKDLENKLNINDGQRCNLEEIVNELEEANNSQNVKISKLIEDNNVLKQIVQEQVENIKTGNQEKQQMIEEIDIKNCNIQDLNCEIRAQINNLNNLRIQNDKLNCINIQLEENIKNLEMQTNILKVENENLNNNLINEKAINLEENKKNEELSNILDDREKTLNQLNFNIENIKIVEQNDLNINNLLQEENMKLRKHIMTLTELNQSLYNEIDNVIEEDEKMGFILNRKDRISSLLLNNRLTLDVVLNNLDEGINNECFICKNHCECMHECH